MSNRIVGIAWYDGPEEFEQLRAMCEDADKFEDTFEQWKESASKLMRTLKLKGERVLRIPLDPKAFSAWCQKRKQSLNGAARSAYAAEQVEEQAAKNPPPDIEPLGFELD